MVTHRGHVLEHPQPRGVGVARTDRIADPLMLLELPSRVAVGRLVELRPAFEHQPEERPHHVGQDLVLRRVGDQQVELRCLHDRPATRGQIRTVRVQERPASSARSASVRRSAASLASSTSTIRRASSSSSVTSFGGNERSAAPRRSPAGRRRTRLGHGGSRRRPSWRARSAPRGRWSARRRAASSALVRVGDACPPAGRGRPRGSVGPPSRRACGEEPARCGPLGHPSRPRAHPTFRSISSSSTPSGSNT